MRENVKETERTITVDWQDGSKYSGEIMNGGRMVRKIYMA